MAAVVPSWAAVADVVDYLGLAATDATDAAYLARVTDAANAWAFRRRQQAGYIDEATVVPGPDVALGVTMAAGAWYRRRGAPDGFAGWADMGANEAWTPGGIADVHRLLGISRPLAV